MSKRSQKDYILGWLKAGHTITSYQAFKELKITRLSSIIHTLRDEGYDIESRMAYNQETDTEYAKYKLLIPNKGGQYNLL